MIKFKRKGANAGRKLFFLDDDSIYTIVVFDKKSHRRYKKFFNRYYGLK